MKNKLLKNISLAVSCLLGVAGVITAGVSTINEKEVVPAEAATIEQLYSVTNSIFISNTNTEFTPYSFKSSSVSFGNTPRNNRLDSYITYTPDLKKVTSIEVYVDFKAGGSTYSSSVSEPYYNNVSYTLELDGSVIKSASNLGANGSISFTHTFSSATDKTIKLNFHDDENKNPQSTYFYNFSLKINGYYCSKITFNKQSGTGGSDSVIAENGNNMPSASMPTRTNYKFLGYYDAASGGTKYYNANGSSAKAWNKKDHDVTLYAQWELDVQSVSITKGTGLKNVYVSSNSNVTNVSSSDLKASGSKFNVNSKVYGYAQLAKGYKSKSGWTLKAGTANSENALYLIGNGTVGTSGYNFGTISADLATYSISYNLNGGSVSGNPTSYNMNSSAITLKNPSKTGYTINGWSGTGITGTSSSVTIANGSIGNRSYTANWTANQYDVTLNAEPGSFETQPSAFKVTYDAVPTTLTSDQIPTRESSGGHSYSFGGYYTEQPKENADGSQTPNGKKYFNESGEGAATWAETQNATLYTYWTIDMEVVSSGWTGKWASSSEDASKGVKRGISVSVNYPDDTTIYYGTSIDACNDTNKDHFLHDEVGEYTVYFEVRKDGYTTYKGSEVVTITKEDSIINPRPSAKTSLEFKDQDQELIVIGEVDYGNMLYAVNTTGELPLDSEYSDAIPTGKLVGTYYVFYKTSGDLNHFPYDVKEAEKIAISIARVNRSEIEALNDEVVTYYSSIVDKYPEIASTLEGVRSEVYDDAIVEDNITSQGVNDNIIKLKEALSAAKVAVTEAKINAIGEVKYPHSKEAIEDANNYFDNVLNEEEKLLVSSSLKEVLDDDTETFNNVDESAKAINDILNPQYSDDYFNSVKDARTIYDNLSEEEKAILNETEDGKYLKDLTDNETAEVVIKEIHDIGDISYDGGVKDSLSDIEAAETSYKALTPDQQELVNLANHNQLVDDRNTYNSVENTIRKIEEIGKVIHNAESEDKINTAKETYDGLSDKAKELVKGYEDTYKTLDDAEHVYDALEKIDSIGSISYDETCKAKLDEARKTYDALSDDQKAAIEANDLKTLTDDEATYDAVEKINEIGTIVYDYESKDRIDEARAYYNSLTEDQKALVNPHYLAFLEESEQDFSNKETIGNVLVIVFLILSCILLIAGLIVLFLLLRKKKNNDDSEGGNGGKPVNAMSISFPLILASVGSTSHYLDAPYIALYIIAGLTILVWLVNLIVFIYKKHQKKVVKESLTSLAEDNSEEESSEEESSDEDESSLEESEIASDDNGNRFIIRYIKSFLAKLIQSSDETKDYYQELKNYALSYEGTSSRVSWHYDSINVNKVQFLKLGIRGKKLCLYLPLNPEELDEKYKVEKIESQKYEKVPCMYRINNEKRLKYAKALIRMVASKVKLKLGEEKSETYEFPYEERDPLIKKGLIRVKKSLEGNPSEEVLSVVEDEEGNEVITTKDIEGHLYQTKYVKSFTARLIHCDDEAKHMYQELKNYALSYNGVSARLSWLYDSINYGREPLLKLNIRGKTLYLYYALDTEKLGEKYLVEKVESKKYASVPCLYRIKSSRRLNYSKELIDRVMKKYKLVKDKELNDDYYLPYEEKDVLIKKGYIRERKIRIK